MAASVGATSQAEVDRFTTTLMGVFGNDDWDDIRPFAELAWKGLAYTSRPWSLVEAEVSERWRDAISADFHLALAVGDSEPLRYALTCIADDMADDMAENADAPATAISRLSPSRL